MTMTRDDAILTVIAELRMQMDDADAELVALRDTNTTLREAVAQRDETIVGLERHISEVERSEALSMMQPEPQS